MVRQGFSSGGTPPRGYLAEKVTIGHKRDGSPRIVSRWVVDPELWDLVILAWTMRAEGKTYAEIREATGGRLYKDKNSWTTFFRNKSYLGIGKFGNLEIPNHHPAAIDQETWDKVQSLRRAAPRFGLEGQSNHPRRIKKPTLLSSLAHCIHCGSAITFKIGNPNFKPWPYYQCGKKSRKGWKSCEGQSIHQPNADKAIMGAIMGRILTVDFFYALLDETKAQMSNVQEVELRITTLEKSLKECERAIINLLDLAETFGAKSAVERLKEREVEKVRILHDLTTLKAKKQAAQLEISPEALTLALEAWQRQIIEAQEQENVRALRELLKNFVSKIELGYNKAVIWYTYPLEENGISSNANSRQKTLLLGAKSLVLEWSYDF